jgi:hypothetical protein
MAITLKEENILDEWSMILDRAADHGDRGDDTSTGRKSTLRRGRSISCAKVNP